MDRHGYEIVRGACRPFFDLECEGDELPRGDGHAVAVAEAALAVMAELAAPLRLSVRIDTIAVDSSHARKFSRHLVVTVSLAETGEAVLLRGPRKAGVVAARVAELVGAVSERPHVAVKLTDEFKRVLEIARANLAAAKGNGG